MIHYSESTPSSSTNKGTVAQTSSDEKYQYTTYYYRLYQKDNEGLWSTGSNVVKARIKNSPPTTPVITFPEKDGDSIWCDATLRWTKCADPNNHVVKYRILINHNNSGYIQFATDLIDTSIQLQGYDSLGMKFKVIAYDSEGDSSSAERQTYLKWWGKTTDIDGNVYHVLKIGAQFWMVENLKTTRYNDGTDIPLVTDSAAWSDLTIPRYCWYNNDSATYANPYGALYNWNTVNTGKLAPAGWHVPTDAEWDILQNYLIANGYNWDGTTTGNKTAKSLAAKTNWTTSTSLGAIGNDLTNNNRTGFSALPGGWRSSYYNFAQIGIFGYWWSSTECDSVFAYHRYLCNDGACLYRFNTLPKSCGFSVRLLRD